MAVAIQSTSSGSETVASPLTLTKPTGLAVGDLMVAVICHFDPDGVFPTVPSGWSNELSFSPGDDNVMIRVFIKNAEASDVSASNFSFAVSTFGSNLEGILYRIDGHGQTTQIQDLIQGEGAETGGSFSFSDSMTPNQPNALLIAIAYGLGNEGDFTGWTVTGGTNPTWTDRFSGVDDSGLDSRFEVADATYASTTTITGGSVTMSTSYTSAGMSVLMIPPAVNAEGTQTTQENLTLTTNTHTISVGTTGSQTTQESLTLVANTPTGTADNDKWTNETKSTPSPWTNETKS